MEGRVYPVSPFESIFGLDKMSRFWFTLKFYKKGKLVRETDIVVTQEHTESEDMTKAEALVIATDTAEKGAKSMCKEHKYSKYTVKVISGKEEFKGEWKE